MKKKIQINSEGADYWCGSRNSEMEKCQNWMWLQDVLSLYMFILKYTVVTLWSIIAVLLFLHSTVFYLPHFLHLYSFRNFHPFTCVRAVLRNICTCWRMRINGMCDVVIFPDFQPSLEEMLLGYMCSVPPKHCKGAGAGLRLPSLSLVHPWRTLRRFSRVLSVVGNSFLLCRLVMAKIYVLEVLCLFKVGGL